MRAIRETAATAYGACRTHGKRADAFPTGPWTAHRPRRPQRSTGSIVVSVTDEKAGKMTSQMEGAPGMR